MRFNSFGSESTALNSIFSPKNQSCKLQIELIEGLKTIVGDSGNSFEDSTSTQATDYEPETSQHGNF